MLPLAFALGAGSQMLQPLAIAVIGGPTLWGRSRDALATMPCQSVKRHLGKKAEVELTEVVGSLRVQ
jgi:hypothetical protein